MNILAEYGNKKRLRETEDRLYTIVWLIKAYMKIEDSLLLLITKNKVIRVEQNCSHFEYT